MVLKCLHSVFLIGSLEGASLLDGNSDGKKLGIKEGVAEGTSLVLGLPEGELLSL